jgi:hypothetical protein
MRVETRNANGRRTVMLYTRRELGRLALAGLPAAALLKPRDLFAMRAAKPDSKWAGVQVGMNMPYNLGNNNLSGDVVLDACLQLGVSAVELRSQPVEAFLGSPAAVTVPAGGGRAAGGRRAGGGGRGGRRGEPTPEQRAAQQAAAEALARWRLSVPMSRVAEFRKKYEDAGVLIQIVKFDNIFTFSDDVLDYCFTLAKTLGAHAISCEMPIEAMDGTKRLGQFADKHQIWVGYHGHEKVTPEIWEQAFSYAKYNGANLDLGHFLGGLKKSPIPFLKEHHDRITHMHVKDKTLEDKNVPFGQGDTPIKEALQLLRDNKWPRQATIEFEYPIPTGSDRMTELAKCVQYCKDCLLS